MHTPRPWIVENGKWDTALIVCSLKKRRRYGRQWTREIACLKGIKDDDYANARLIAAAPELLEALKLLYARLHESRFKMDVKHDYSLLVADAAASKAIFKAEGR